MANAYLDTVEPAPSLAKVKLNMVEKPQRVWFYQRLNNVRQPTEDAFGPLEVKPDEGIFACYEQEAAGLSPLKFRQIGCGDGNAWLDYFKNSGVKRGQSIPIEKAQEIIRGAFKAELEAARGKIVPPIAQKVFFPDGSVPMDMRDNLKLPR